MKLQKTRDALGTLGFTHDVSGPMAEVQAAEELADMLRTLIETHWTEGAMRPAVREAEALLERVTSVTP